MLLHDHKLHFNASTEQNIDVFESNQNNLPPPPSTKIQQILNKLADFNFAEPQ